jgi:hypothetical protein
MRELLTELNRHRGELLIRVPDVVRSLLADASLDVVHEALLTLFKHGAIELRPGGGTESMKAEDLALCPPGPRGTSFIYARWTDTNGR